MAYVYEFLYRGRPNGESAYHVVLAEEVTDSFGRNRLSESNALTPAQAEALGFPLPTIIVDINAAVMAERDQAVTEKVAAEAARDRAIADLASLSVDATR